MPKPGTSTQRAELIDLAQDLRQKRKLYHHIYGLSVNMLTMEKEGFSLLRKGTVKKILALLEVILFPYCWIVDPSGEQKP